jgi:4-amino-4-deoxy-L-arabinose transferase-like glycosyltransferase
MTEHAAPRAGARSWAASPAVRRIAWALLLALPLLWMLGSVPLFDVDEGAFSEATREMLTSGDWLHTTLNGAPRFDKPIGVYWLQAISASVFGLNEFALRLPSVLSCWAMALALGAFARRRWGDLAGMLAGALVVTSLGPLAIGRGATADSLLNLLLALAGLDLWRFSESESRTALRRAYAWVGLGLLVKGPVAVLVPGAAFFLWVAFSKRWTLLRKAALDAPGWALLLAIAVPWYAYALHRHGMAFINGFLLQHNVDRFTGTLGGHRGNFLYYVAVLPLLAMPWAPLLVLAVVRARRFWAEPVGRYLLLWAAFVLVFFSMSGTKLPHYMLYGYPPLVLLMARLLADASRRLVLVVAAGIVMWAGIVAALPSVIVSLADKVRDPLYHALIAGAPAAPMLPAVVALVVVAAIAFWRTRAELAPLRVIAAGGVLSLFAAGWLLPWFASTLQAPIRHAAAIAAAHGGHVVQWDVHYPSFSVYLRDVVPRREPRPDEMILSRTDRLPPGNAGGRPRLFEERGIVLLGPLPTR